MASHHRLTRVSAQLDYSAEDRQLLEEIHRSFSTHFHAFEGFAALIAERVVGPRCLRAWVTPRTADGGVDFVCRLDLGTDFSQTSAVVLPQAKCLPPAGSVNGRDVARLVARLRRGWSGAFVTTGAFSVSCQREILEDRYPVVLVNGKRVAREVRQLLNIEGLPLASLLEREKAWYEANRRPVDPERVLDDAVLGSEVTAGLGVLVTRPANALRAIDLFSGAGGASAGARLAGVEVVAAVDTWPLAAKVYKDNFPSAQHHLSRAEDLDPRDVQNGLVARLDLLIASPECTSHTCARAMGKGPNPAG